MELLWPAYQGLIVTGMNRPIFWGLYMVNFIFFIGISQAGTLISAVLRLTGAEWRRPITRVAEVITSIALIVASLQIIIDMGRPDRLLLAFPYGRMQSPILWDIISLSAYLLASMTYLYLPLIPDVAIVRDNCPASAPAWQRQLYTVLALGWRGNKEQWRRLEKAVSIMAIFITPVAVSVHTITSWILATTVQPGWHSSIFGPYFVVGALFSGIGALFLLMTVVQRTLKLEDYITETQYRNLGLLFITMVGVWAYFTLNESMGIAAAQQLEEFPILEAKLWGQHSLSFWLMVGLHGFAFWVLVVPKLLPDAWRQWDMLRPAPALLATNVAAAALLMLIWPEPTIIGIDLSMPNLTPVLWVLVYAGFLWGGFGLAAWLKDRLITATVIASISVVIGMWQERWLIIVPTMTHPRFIPFTIYLPTWTEISLSVASIALFSFMVLMFFKFFPAVSIWEIAEGRVIAEAESHLTIPAPKPTATRRRLRWGRNR